MSYAVLYHTALRCPPFCDDENIDDMIDLTSETKVHELADVNRVVAMAIWQAV